MIKMKLHEEQEKQEQQENQYERVCVVTEHGRVLDITNIQKTTISIQDNGKTLKIFIQP